MTEVGARRRVLFLAGNAAVDRTLEVAELVPGSIHRPVAELALAGGKGINAARAAHTLGADVIVVAITAGQAGAYVAEHLANEGIPARLVEGPGETRTCISILDRSDGRLTEFYESGPPVDQSTWDAVLQVIRREIERADLGVLVCSGSLAPGSPEDLYAQVVHLGNQHDLPVFVDAAGPFLAQALGEHPALVKINESEALGASGLNRAEGQAPIHAVQWLADHGAVRAVVTLGADGAIGLDSGDGALLHVERFETQAPYPVGSGDAFMAGLAIADVRDEPFANALAMATAAGIANAMLPGAGRLDPKAVLSLRAGIQVSRIGEGGDRG